MTMKKSLTHSCKITLIILTALFCSHAENCFADTFIVKDTSNGTTSDGISLRWAFTQANAGGASADTIVFNLPGTAPFIIHLTSALPSLNDDGNFIDGFTQPDSTHSGSLPKVIIDGASSVSTGIRFQGSKDNKVTGLWIRNFSNYGIELSGAQSFAYILKNMVTGCGRDGIYVSSTGHAEIEGNNISANLRNGIYLNSNTGSIIRANKIGIDTAGIGAGNVAAGIQVTDDSHFIGGDSAWEANVIAYNGTYGINISQTGSNYILIQRNSFYCNVSGAMFFATNVNDNMAAPVITSANDLGASGTAPPNSLVEIYYTDSSCTTCEGKIFIGSVLADVSGNWLHTASLTLNKRITATAIDISNNNTSLFSQCVMIIAAAVSTKTNDEVVSIFPNPCRNSFTVKNISYYTAQNAPCLQIINTLGEIIYTVSPGEVEAPHTFTINTTDFSNGIYFLMITSKENIFTKKIVVEK
jgi:parallel beta-helix repeat protein